MRSADTRRRATITDVALAASVSRQTVSNAINRPHVVRPQTLARVKAEIERLGYRPSQAARNMRSQRAGAVGIEVNAVTRDGNDVAHSFLTELTVTAPRFDVHLVPFAHASVFPSVAGYQDMVRRQLVDAFVISDTHVGDPRPQWLTERGIPFAAFGRIYDHPELHGWTDVDGHAGTAAAVRHLEDRGYGTVGYLGWPRPDHTSVLAGERRSGWQDAATGLGSLGPEAVCEQDLLAATDAAGGLLDQLAPGDAVVCASDLLALGVLYATYARGWLPGRDFGIVGFDGSPIARRHGLTSIAQPLDALATALLAIVHDQLAGGPPTTSDQLLTPSLVPGPTTDRTQAPRDLPLPPRESAGPSGTDEGRHTP